LPISIQFGLKARHDCRNITTDNKPVRFDALIAHRSDPTRAYFVDAADFVKQPAPEVFSAGIAAENFDETEGVSTDWGGEGAGYETLMLHGEAT